MNQSAKDFQSFEDQESQHENEILQGPNIIGD